MGKKIGFKGTERLARITIMMISIVGGLVLFQCGFLKVGRLEEPLIFCLLVLFLFIVELYPMPVWRGYTTISFPLVYAIYVMHGIGYCLIAYALIVVGLNAFKRRPLRIVLFNPAQLIISLVIGHIMASWLLPSFINEGMSPLLTGMIHLTFVIVPFYLVNNLIVDFVLTVRPQPYTISVWKQKSLQELNSFLISYVYLVLFYTLGSQNRGEIDVISFFFFFSPLVGLALLSSIIIRLKKEKARLKALFNISSELNRKIADKDWLRFVENHLLHFIEVDAYALWTKDSDTWTHMFSNGLVKDYAEKMADLQNINKLTIIHDTKRESGPAVELFQGDIRSVVYAPLILEEEIVGLFLFGKSRTKSFNEEDVQSAVTIANQLAVLIKTKSLFAEQEKTLILEERNRIARDIHDGVAQSLAGAVMKLETAERKFTKMPEDSLRLIHESVEKLRHSLKEVRESIYALRPYPTERVGLVAAIQARLQAMTKENSVELALETRGNEFPLSSMVEKIIFDIFQESVQNAIKHSEASRIEILLSYQKEHVLLKVKDDGVGFSLFHAMLKARKEPHFGILHMNEAAEKIHASLQVDSKEGAGTEIALTVPKMGIEGGNES